MYVSEIRLYNFRNYTLQDIRFSKDINVIYGENAQGKTNILEAVYIASNGCSHRTTDIYDCIKWNERQSGVLIEFYRNSNKNTIRYILSSSNGKKFILNDNSARHSDITGSIGIVMFSPEDLMMIKGSPRQRRLFLDHEVSQASKIYSRNLKKFNRVLQQRNTLLKNINYGKSNKDMLEEWNDQFANLAEAIVLKRIEAIKRISMLSNLAQRKLSNKRENLLIEYQITGLAEDYVPTKAWYIKQLENNTFEDIARMSTSIGPQRDDFSVKINNYDCKHFGSQGQQRTCVLSLKMAEVEYIRSETGEYPVMLLDDIMSELDTARQQQILNSLSGKVQTFITATGSDFVFGNNAAKYIHVNDGSVFQNDK